MTELGDKLVFDRRRIEAMLVTLERMAAGDMTVALPISDNRDELDAIAHAINVLSDELRYASSKMAEAEKKRLEALLKEKD